MWNAYSASYIKNNKTGNRFIMIISFLAAMMLSLVSGLFYNLWADQVNIRSRLHSYFWHISAA